MAFLRWSRSSVGVVYLANADGGEHYRTCAGVPDDESESFAAEPIPAPIAERAPSRVLLAEPIPELDPIAVLGDELDEAERMHEAYAADARKVAEWPSLRRQILAYGGIGPSPDWPRDWYPGDLYRANGKAPDLVAAEAVAYAPWGDTGDDSAMLDYLHRSWSEWQRAQGARRPRARKVEARPVAEALTPRQPSPLVGDVAQLVADVARLVADAAAGTNAGTYSAADLAAIASTAADLARLVRG